MGWVPRKPVCDVDLGPQVKRDPEGWRPSTRRSPDKEGEDLEDLESGYDCNPDHACMFSETHRLYKGVSWFLEG